VAFGLELMACLRLIFHSVLIIFIYFTFGNSCLLVVYSLV